MFLKSFRFHLTKFGLNKPNIIIITSFFLGTIFMLVLMNVLALNNSRMSFYGFVTIAFMTLFFISIINILLVNNIIQNSKTSRIESLEKRNGMKYWEMFLTRTCASKIITIPYISFVIIIWAIVIGSLRLDNYVLMFYVVTPGLCFIYLYDLSFYGFLSLIIYLGKQKTSLILGSIIGTLVALAPALISLPAAIFGGGTFNDTNTIVFLKSRLELGKYFEPDFEDSLLQNSMWNRNNEEEIINMVQMTPEAITYAEGDDDFNFWWWGGSNYNRIGNFSDSGLFLNILPALNEATRSKNPNINFDSFEFTPEFKESFQFKLYAIFENTLNNHNLAKGSLNSSFLRTNRLDFYTGTGQLRDTYAIFNSPDFFEEFSQKLKGLGVNLTQTEWNTILATTRNIILNFSFMNSPGSLHSELSRIFKDEWLNQNDYYGLMAFLYNFFQIANNDRTYSHHWYGTVLIQIQIERYSPLQIIYNSLTYTGARNFIQQSGVYKTANHLTQSLPVVGYRIIGDIVDTGSSWSTSYENITEVVLSKNIMYIYYLINLFLGLGLIGLSFLVYKKKIYEN